MSPDEELMLIFGALHLVALALGVLLFVMFLRSDTADGGDGPEEDEGGGGGGSDRISRHAQDLAVRRHPAARRRARARAPARARAARRPAPAPGAPAGHRAAPHAAPRARARAGARYGYWFVPL